MKKFSLFLLPLVIFFLFIYEHRQVVCANSIADLQPSIYSEVSEPSQQGFVDSFYALGDWGTANTDQHLVARLLKADLERVAQNKPDSAPFVLGLGDVTYAEPTEDPAKIVHELMNTFGEVYRGLQVDHRPITFHIVPGNHDYHKASWVFQEFAAKLFDGSNSELPIWKFYSGRAALPHPQGDTGEVTSANEVFPTRISAETRAVDIIAIDSQLFLELYRSGDARAITRGWSRVSAMLSEGTKPWRIVVGHHPVISHGSHGKVKPLWKHLLDRVRRHSIQNLDTPEYRNFSKDLIAIMQQQNVTFYLSGHEHNLQLLDLGKNNFQVISGSAGEARSVNKCPDTIYADPALGFVRFDANDAGIRLSFLSTDYEGNTVKNTSRSFLFSKNE
jgi:hypothetical protein